MSQSGLQAALNASEIFLSEQQLDSDFLAGLAIAVVMDGSRAFLIEIQVVFCYSNGSKFCKPSNPLWFPCMFSNFLIRNIITITLVIKWEAIFSWETSRSLLSLNLNIFQTIARIGDAYTNLDLIMAGKYVNCNLWIWMMNDTYFYVFQVFLILPFLVYVRYLQL